LDTNEAEPKEKALVVAVLPVAALLVVDELNVVPISEDFEVEQGTVFELCPKEIDEVELKFFSIDIEKVETGGLDADLSTSDSV